MVAAVRSSYPLPESPRARRSRVRRSRRLTPYVQGSTVAAVPEPLSVVSASAQVSASGVAVSKIAALRTARPLPLWLRTLCLLQKGTSLMTLVLGVVTLVCYGAVVYSQQRWSEAYHSLDELREKEYQLTAAHESFRQGISASAPASELPVLPSSDAIVFLEPTAIRPGIAPEPPPTGQFIQNNFPLGY